MDLLNGHSKEWFSQVWQAINSLSLVSHFNIEAGQSHRALNDARATLALFVHCLDNCAVPGIVQVKKDGFNKFNNTNEK